MNKGPQLSENEEILHHHTPDLGAFKKTALLLLAITLVPTVVMVFLLPDTFWVAVPMFVTCLLLMQERYNLGKYAAWITDQRIVLQGDQAHQLADIASVDMIGNAVRMRFVSGGPRVKLYYPKDRQALRDLIETARRGLA